MLDLNLQGVDLEKAAAGVLIQYEGPIKFRIARANTPGYRSAVRRIMKMHKRQIENGSLSDEQSDKITAQLMAEHILVDWEGLSNDGENFPYTKENAEAFLGDPQYAEIREWIMAQAQDLENFRSEEAKK